MLNREGSARRDTPGPGSRFARGGLYRSGPLFTRGAAGPGNTGEYAAISVPSASCFGSRNPRWSSAELHIRRDVPRVLPPPHQARDLIGFFQPVHPGAQPVLVAVFLRTELAVAAYS
jgi:hypothetical protein